jgi:polyferredoxin
MLLDNRRLIQIAFLLIWAVAPFFDLFRIDIVSGKLYLLTLRLWLRDSYLFLLAFLTVVLLVLLLAKIFGRAACGWICPRNTLLELGKSKGWGRVLSSIGLGVATSVVTLSYFIDPNWLLSQIMENPWRGVAIFCWIITTIIGLDFLLVGHKFCQSGCPYGIIQYLFTDENTLRVQYCGPCLDCGNCGRSCYLLLNPRAIDRHSCVNCGQCVAACRTVAATKHLPPYLSFYFGGNALPGLKDYQTWSLGLVFFLFAGAFSWGIIHYQSVEVVLTKQSHRVVTYDALGNFQLTYQLQVTNGSDEEVLITFSQQGMPREMVSFIPARALTIAGGQSQEVLLVVKGTRGSLDPDNQQIQVEALANGRVKTNLKLNFFLQEVTS